MLDKKTVYEMGVFVCEMKEKSCAKWIAPSHGQSSDLTFLLF